MERNSLFKLIRIVCSLFVIAALTNAPVNQANTTTNDKNNVWFISQRLHETKGPLEKICKRYPEIVHSVLHLGSKITKI
jgi:hypothetical protein